MQTDRDSEIGRGTMKVGSNRNREIGLVIHTHRQTDLQRH